jgi:cytochrome b pre-mRNA-processing protein 3
MWPFVRRRRSLAIERLYDAVASLARRPHLFAEFGVADTFEGRFEMLTLHLALLLRRLALLPSPASDVAQELIDLNFLRLDQGLREIGVGDVGVPKRMKRLARAFYGRVGAYDAALKDGDGAALAEALRRNVLAAGQGDPEALAADAAAIDRELAGRGLEDLLAGRLASAEPRRRQASFAS